MKELKNAQDIVFTVKKGIQLDQKNKEQVVEFKKNIIFIFRHISHH
jgi:hypothetical protein